jgi:hypothetical protein
LKDLIKEKGKNGVLNSIDAKLTFQRVRSLASDPLEGEDDPQGPATAQLTLLQVDLAPPPPPSMNGTTSLVKASSFTESRTAGFSEA